MTFQALTFALVAVRATIGREDPARRTGRPDARPPRLELSSPKAAVPTRSRGGHLPVRYRHNDPPASTLPCPPRPVMGGSRVGFGEPVLVPLFAGGGGDGSWRCVPAESPEPQARARALSCSGTVAEGSSRGTQGAVSEIEEGLADPVRAGWGAQPFHVASPHSGLGRITEEDVCLLQVPRCPAHIGRSQELTVIDDVHPDVQAGTLRTVVPG